MCAGLFTFDGLFAVKLCSKDQKYLIRTIFFSMHLKRKVMFLSCLICDRSFLIKSKIMKFVWLFSPFKKIENISSGFKLYYNRYLKRNIDVKICVNTCTNHSPKYIDTPKFLLICAKNSIFIIITA